MRRMLLGGALDAQLRLSEVASRLLIAAAPICADAQHPVFSLSVVNRNAFDGEYIPLATNAPSGASPDRSVKAVETRQERAMETRPATRALP